MKKLLSDIKIPILLIVINSIIAHYIYAHFASLGTTIFNITRAILFIWVGWLIVVKSHNNLIIASIAGAFLLFIDHVLLNGIYLLLSNVWNHGDNYNLGMRAFSGLVVSYFLFAPISMALGLFGGWIGRKKAIPSNLAA